jgi:hypothetical protein
LNSLAPLFATPVLYFQRLARSFAKTGGVGGLPLRRLSALWRYHLPVVFLGLCFHILTNCFSRKRFIFTTIRIARGCGVQHAVLTLDFWCSVANGVGSAEREVRTFPSLCALDALCGEFLRRRVGPKERKTSYSRVVRLWTCCSRAWLY